MNSLKSKEMDVPRNQLLQVIPAGTYNMQNVVKIRQLVDSKNESEEVRNVKPCQIKSSAVDLYTAAPIPATFFKLENNTDLNRPPSNWLSKPRQILGYPLYNRNIFPFPSSFQVASNFLDCVGEVDVVSDAENIKKLLKIPYSKSQVSMMVHRIGKTLLLDDFDIHTHLLRTAENEWSWLRKFYLEHIFTSLQPKEKNDERKSSRHSRTYLQQQNLLAKFLYHSLASESPNAQPDDWQDVQEFQQQRCNTHTSHQEHQEPPTIDQSIPQFSKNIIWTFEDIRMLIGTDLPIFGGKTHPCFSLRLRDMNKPINVLTGIDYWLDNLMSNVPEVVMCYHLGGLVQKYELIKTEDLPRMPDSSFKPGVIRDVAQNILSFLKSKATKPGHTYWLFKGRGDDIVKLYDLTSLCSDMNEDPCQNPFTTPVAMLLFKVAKNLKTSRDWKRHQETILHLLKYCLEILDIEKYPQIATAALYYLADVYLPASEERESNGHENNNVNEDDWAFECEDADVEEPMATRVDDKILSSPQTVHSEKNVEQRKISAISKDWKQRAVVSLENAVQALKCLSQKVRSNEAPSHADEPQLASPLRPIPMPYTDNQKGENLGPVVTKGPVSDWKSQWWRLLLEKCIAAYVTLAELTIKATDPDLEESLYYLRMAGLLWFHLDETVHTSLPVEPVAHSSPLRILALGVAGDTYFLLVQQWGKLSSCSVKQHIPSVTDENLLQILNNCNSVETPVENAFPYPASIQQSLESSFLNYKLAIQSAESLPEPDCTSLSKRLGNVCNELGVFFMSKASNLLEGNQLEWKHQFLEFFQTSLKYLEEGVFTFRNIGDSSNTALLLSNLGKLYRLQARALAPTEMKEITISEWKCYAKALKCYKDALEIPSLHPGIWDAVVWEYTSVLFTLASLLQDFAPLSIKSREEIEDEISGLLLKCIELCDVNDSNVRQPLYQYRSATCNYRLASLYHDSYRNGNGEAVINGKNVRTLAETHYSAASILYQKLENWEECLRIQLEKIGLYEFHLRHLAGTGSKLRVLRLALNCLLSSAPAISALVNANEISTKNLECMEYVCTRLHSTLLQLTKVSKKTTSRKSTTDEEVYKKMYLTSLKCSPKESEFYRLLPIVIEDVSELCSSLDKN